MDTIKPRLVSCFQTVFPSLPEQEIPTATQSTVEAWDSIAAITLVGVIEDEFGIQMEMDALADLDSFPRIHEYVAAGLPS
jgi:acyl carrier protein